MGDYYVAVYQSTSVGVPTYTASGDRAAFTGKASGAGVTFSESNGAVLATQATVITKSASMSVASTGITLSAVPEWVSLLVFAKLGDATPGTDLLFDVSRNGGANWQTIPMAQAYPRTGGSVALTSGKVALTSAAGATAKWRIRMANSKMPEVLALGFMMGASS